MWPDEGPRGAGGAVDSSTRRESRPEGRQIGWERRDDVERATGQSVHQSVAVGVQSMAWKLQTCEVSVIELTIGGTSQKPVVGAV